MQNDSLDMRSRTPEPELVRLAWGVCGNPPETDGDIAEFDDEPITVAKFLLGACIYGAVIFLTFLGALTLLHWLPAYLSWGSAL